MSHNANKDYDRAIAEFTKAIELNPNYAGAYHDRGVSYHWKGDRVRAIADYRRALGNNPDDETRKGAQQKLRQLGADP